MACCAACVGDPIAILLSQRERARARMGDVYGDCDSFQVIVSADPVLALRTRLLGEFEATDAAVQACTALAPEERASWDLVFRSWKASLVVDPNWWNANALFRSACAFGKDLEGWREKLRGKCSSVGPEKVVAAEHAGIDLSVVKWIAAAAVVVGVAYVASPLISAGRAAVKGK